MTELLIKAIKHLPYSLSRERPEEEGVSLENPLSSRRARLGSFRSPGLGALKRPSNQEILMEVGPVFLSQSDQITLEPAVTHQNNEGTPPRKIRNPKVIPMWGVSQDLQFGGFFSILFSFIDLKERGERYISICSLFMHSLIDSCGCPEQKFNFISSSP